MSQPVQNVLLSNEIYRQYYERCLKFAKSYTFNTEISEEIAAEAIVIYWQKISEGTDIPYPMPFMIGVARNKALHYLRSLKNIQEHSKNVNEIANMEFEMRINSLESCNPHNLYNSDIMDILEKSLEGMNDMSRKAFVLSRFEGKSHDEIAELLGISKRTVTHYISRALKSLRSDLKDYLPVLQILLQL